MNNQDEDAIQLGQEKTPVLTRKELREALKGMKSGKAPGVDGVTVSALRIAYERIPEEMLAALNGLLKIMKFPDVWKEGKVVLIPKAGKVPALSSSYRPIVSSTRLEMLAALNGLLKIGKFPDVWKEE